MLNQIVVVGRISDIAEITEDMSVIEMRVPRNFKNEAGEYETDYLLCVLKGSISKNTKEYCGKGDIIGVKRRIARKENEEAMQIIAEKVTFLSSKSKEDNE